MSKPAARSNSVVVLAALCSLAAPLMGCGLNGGASFRQGSARSAANVTDLERQACAEDALRNGANPELPPGATDKLAQECERGELDRCSVLGVMAEIGFGVEHDPPRAAALFTRACDGGNARACVNLGSLYETRSAVARGARSAASLYQGACDAGDAEGCYRLGRASSASDESHAALLRATSLLDESCTAGSGRDCLRLGDRYERGEGLVQSRKQASRYYERACKAGEVEGCITLDRVRDQSLTAPELAAATTALADSVAQIQTADGPSGSLALAR